MANSAFESMLREIYFNIPRDLLEATFRPHDYQVSIDQRIKDVIIAGRVAPDCNVNLGTIKRIPLYAGMIERMNPDPGYDSVVDPLPGTVYRIPPAAREGRDIVGVIDISYPYDYTGFCDTGFGFGISGNTLKSLAGAALDSHTHRNACLTPTPKLLAGNLVMITPTNSYLSDWTLVCRLGFDTEFTNIPNGMIRPLSKLALIACKAYIWVQLTVQIDQAMLSGGQEIGRFKEIVDRFEGALEQYDEELLKVRGASLFDADAVKFLIRSAL